jgi:hypothetical protein
MQFRRIAWSAHAEFNLRRALPVETELQAIRGEVLRGISWLWEIDNGASYMVTRGEPGELVCVAYEGENVRTAAEFILAAAARSGYPSVRFHTQHKALLRMLQDLQPTIEFIARIKTHGRQFKEQNVIGPNDNQCSRH